MLNLSIKVLPLKYYVHHFIMSRLRKSAHLEHVRRMNEYHSSFCGRADVPSHIRRNEYLKKESF
jgi:hypothetical protein